MTEKYKIYIPEEGRLRTISDASDMMPLSFLPRNVVNR